jgi:Holliday junction resolvase
MSETSELTGPLVKMIRQMGIMAMRMNSGKVRVRGGWMQLHSPGTADILCFPRGRVVWLECKTIKGTTNKEQIENQAEFQRIVTGLGHSYHRITSIDEGLAAVR